MPAVEMKHVGTKPGQLESKLRKHVENIEKKGIIVTANKLARMMPKVLSKEIRRKLNVSDRFIRQKRAIVAKVIGGRLNRTVRVSIKTIMIPISEFRPKYSAGREAGLSQQYGTGTQYTIYKGQRETAANVFQRPSVANVDIEPSPLFSGGPSDFYTRHAGEDRAFRRWRGLALSNYYRNVVGRQQLPQMKRTVIAEVKALVLKRSRL